MFEKVLQVRLLQIPFYDTPAVSIYKLIFTSYLYTKIQSNRTYVHYQATFHLGSCGSS